MSGLKTKGYPELDDVLVPTVFNQVVHPKIVSVVLHKVEFGIVVTSDSLKLFEGLYDCPGRSGGGVSGTMALKLQRAASE